MNVACDCYSEESERERERKKRMTQLIFIRAVPSLLYLIVIIDKKI
jgi:hypothetical protein